MVLEPLVDGVEGDVGRLLEGEVVAARRKRAEADVVDVALFQGEVEARGVAGGELFAVFVRDLAPVEVGAECMEDVSGGKAVPAGEDGVADLLILPLDLADDRAVVANPGAALPLDVVVDARMQGVFASQQIRHGGVDDGVGGQLADVSSPHCHVASRTVVGRGHHVGNTHEIFRRRAAHVRRMAVKEKVDRVGDFVVDRLRASKNQLVAQSEGQLFLGENRKVGIDARITAVLQASQGYSQKVQIGAGVVHGCGKRFV